MKVIVTVRSKADPGETRPTEQDGEDYCATLNELTERVPDGWQIFHIRVAYSELVDRVAG